MSEPVAGERLARVRANQSRLAAPRSEPRRSRDQLVGNRALTVLFREAAPTGKPPATDAEQWDADWSDPKYAGARKMFGGPDRPEGTPRERYDVLCPLYKDHGISRPLVYVHESITVAHFFGRETPAHTSLGTALASAEAALRAKGYTERPFKKMWAFNPRTQTGGQWSNHADGKAVDIDELTNPRLLKKRDRAVISALTGFDMSAKNPGASRGLDAYDAAAEASRTFQSRYSLEGIDQRIAVLASEEAEFDELRQAATQEMDAIPRGKKASKGDIARRAAAFKKLKSQQAALKATVAQRRTLEAEKERFQALDSSVVDLETRINQLVGRTETLRQQKELLVAGVDPGAPNPAQTIAATEAAIKASELAIKKARTKLSKATARRDGDALRGYRSRGFLDLKKDLVEALKAAGLGWGGDYRGAKDFMHFEVP